MRSLICSVVIYTKASVKVRVSVINNVFEKQARSRKIAYSDRIVKGRFDPINKLMTEWILLTNFSFLSAASSGIFRRLTGLGIQCHRKDAFDAQLLSEQAVNDISEELMPPHLLFGLFITIDRLERFTTAQ